VPEDPEALVDVVRFSRDPQERKAALSKLVSLGMAERLDQAPAQAPSSGPPAAGSIQPVAKKGRGYLWLLVPGVILFVWGMGRVSQDLRHRSSGTAARQATLAVVEQNLRAAQLIADGESLARSGEIDLALARYREARELYPGVAISARSWNTLCWWGSLYGYASEVMYVCEFGVAMAPEDGGIRDSRGLARALTGDVDGAIQDFQFFVEWVGGDSGRQAQVDRRRGWIAYLKIDVNPFDAQTLEELKHE